MPDEEAGFAHASHKPETLSIRTVRWFSLGVGRGITWGDFKVFFNAKTTLYQLNLNLWGGDASTSIT